MYENILLPTDGSKGAGKGVEHAMDIARKYGANVHVLYVVDERKLGSTPALSSEELAFEKQEMAGEEIMEAVVDEVESAGVNVTTECVRGLPFEEIRRYAEDNDIDLIVMGVHGTSETRKPHIGSTTDRVLRTANVPVLPV